MFTAAATTDSFRPLPDGQHVRARLARVLTASKCAGESPTISLSLSLLAPCSFWNQERKMRRAVPEVSSRRSRQRVDGSCGWLRVTAALIVASSAGGRVAAGTVQLRWRAAIEVHLTFVPAAWFESIKDLRFSGRSCRQPSPARHRRSFHGQIYIEARPCHGKHH